MRYISKHISWREASHSATAEKKEIENAGKTEKQKKKEEREFQQKVAAIATIKQN